MHPFRAAWQTRDLEAWSSTFAPDIVVQSPLIKTPFRGKEAAAELYGVLFDVLGEVEVVHESVDGDSHAFLWRAQAGRRTIEGADFIRYDARGMINEIRVLIRPLAGLAAFARVAGPSIAAKRGPVRAWVLRVLTVPLGPLFAAVDFLAPRLTQRRR